MITRKQFILSAFSAIAAGSLAACGGSGDSGNAPVDESTAREEANTLLVAATPTPNAQILKGFAAPLLAKKDISLEAKVYTDYTQPNDATILGEVDANYFQNNDFLDTYNKQNNSDLKSLGVIHYEPYGVYSNRHGSLEEATDGTVFAIPNDPTSEGRALLLLQQEGLITLANPENLMATPADIAENPRNLQFQETESLELISALDVVDFAVISGVFATEAGKHVSEALAVESKDSKTVERYGSIICTTAEMANDERVVALVEALRSEDFAAYLKENYDQDVLPAV